MDIEVLNDLYSRARNLGYSKSRESFRVLVSEDANVFNDNYEYIKSQGYTKGQDSFRELLGIDVKKKDISKPVGDGKVITDSTTEQVQAQDILSALQPGKPEDTPIPLRPEEEVVVEEPETQPIEFDPKTGVPLSGPVDTQFKFDETQEAPIKEKEFEYVDDEIKNQIKKRLIKTPGLESVADEDIEVLESKFPNLYYEALDVITSEAKAVNAYDSLSDDIKKQIEPAVVKQGGKVIGIDFSVLDKQNIESLIKKAKNQESVKEILENYISEEKIAYKAAGIKGKELLEEIKDIDSQIEYIKSRGFGFEEIDKLQIESNKKKTQYQNLYNYSAEQSVLLNSAEIAQENVEMNPVLSVGASAVESFLTLGVQALPVVGSTLLNLGVSAGLPRGAQPVVRVFSSEKEKEWMEWSLEKKKEIEKFIPTDFDDTKANFIGNVVGQIGFIVGSSVLGGTPLAIAAGYTMSMGEMYEEAVANGLDHDDAMNLSIAYGTISAPLEVLGARKGIEALAGKNLRKKVINEILEKGAKGFTKEVAEEAVKVSLTPVLKATAFEAGEEGLQEGAQYLISKGLAETYNALKDEDKDEFIKSKIWSWDFWSELGKNVVLGAAGGAIGGASLNLLGGNVFVGSNYKAMEDMFLDSKQMAKVNDQLTAYRKNGTIKTDEELQAAKEQVGIVQSAAAEVFNATKTRPDKVGSAQQKRLFELTAERLSIQKEIEGVNTPSLVADRKQRIEELDQEISDVITGKITTEEILDRDKAKTEVTEEVTPEEEVTEPVKVDITKENKRVDDIFAEEDFDVSEKLSDNLARNKSPEFQIGEKENKVIGLATKAAKAIQRVAPNVRVVLHDTTEEYNEFGREGSKGIYNPQTKTIHIDLSEATNTTVAHETFHSILFNTIGTEKDIEAATNDMYESVKRALATSPITKRKIRKFSEKYEDNIQSEEALSELFGMLSTDYKQLSAPVKVKIKQFINKVATKFGLGDIIQLSEQDISDLETIDLLNTMSARVKEGKTILKKEAKPLTDKKVKDKKPDTSNENPAIREQKGLINITEKDVIKFKKADITEKRTIQAINQIGLSQVKFKREEILKKISEEFEKLMKNSDDYLISVDGPAITASIQNEIDNAAEQGYSLEYLENLTGALEEGSPQRKQYFDTFVNTQRSSIEQWKNYLSQSDYDPAFKYLILDAVLTNNYDYKLNKYQKRTKSTIRGFTPFDAGSLAEVYASDSKELLKDYVVSQVNNAKNIAEKQLMVTTNEGKWLKFEGGPNANNIEASANALSQLVQDTYWCTKTNAKSQLEGGDFYVYVTDDAGGNPIPRIAVRMEGDRVGEVRGNASAAQDLEADMLPVAEKFLVDNIPNDSGKRWLESINYNKKIKNFTEKINKQKMKIDFVYEYGEILAEEKKFRVDYDENGLVSLMKEDFNQILSESDLFKNKEVVFDEEQMNENTKVLLGGFFGTVEIPNSLKIIIGDFRQIKSYEAEGAGMGVISGLSPIVEAKSLKNITTITGNILSNEITDLGKLENVGGDFNLRNLQVKSLGTLKTLGGSLYLQNSQVTDLGKLKSVGGVLNLQNSQVTDLGKLENIGLDLNLENTQVKSLGNLKSIGGSIYTRNSQVESLGNLETVGALLSLSDQVSDLGNLKSVGGDVFLEASQVKSLGNLKSVGGGIRITNSQVEDLGSLESVGNNLNLKSSKVTDLGNLKYVGRTLDLQKTQVKSLGNLETVDGVLNLQNSQVTDLGKLKSVGKRILIGKELKDLGNLESVGGDFSLLGNTKIKSLGKLKSVGEILDLRDSQAIDLENLETVGYLDLKDSQVKDLGKLKTVRVDADLRYSQVKSLGNLERVGGDLDLRESQVTSLGNLETVGGDIDLEGLQITSLGNLKRVGKGVFLEDSQVTSLGNLERVGGVLELNDSQVTDLGKLKSVGASARLDKSKVTDLGNLQTVDGNINLQNLQITSLGKLKAVGGSLYLQDSQVTDLGDLEFVGGRIEGNNELAKKFEDSKQKPAIREQKADVSKIKEARSKLSKAKKNLKRKLGAAVDAGPLLNRLLAVNPTIVPESVYDKYLEILDMLSENAEELKLDKAQEVSTKTEEILNKIEDESAKEPEKEKGKKKEYKREKNKLIKDIKKAASVRNPKFALNEESVFAKYLKKLANSKAVEELSINELKTLSRVLDNINNGWLSHTAWKYATKLQGITNSNVATDAIAKAKLGFVTNAYNNFKRFIRFTEKGTVQKALESIPKYYIDQALSVGQSTDIFDSVLRGIAEAEQIYNFDLRAINKRITAVENAVLKSLKYDGNKAIESSVKQMIYLLNLEYKSNEGNTQVNPVIDFINETIANKKTDKVEKERLNKIKKEYFDGKKLKEKKLYDSFNKAEKESIKEIQKINAELGSKALYTAGVVRGDRIDLLNNYVHHVVIDEKFDGSEVKNVESQIKDFVDSRKPTTKAKSLIQRTGKVTPLNFDIYNSASRGAKYTLMDFYLTEPISTVRETLKRTEEKLKEKGIYDEKSDIFEGIEALLEQDIETTLTNNIASSDLIERVVGEISKVAYQRILLNTKRLAQELLGNMSYIVLKGRKAFKEGIKYFDVMSSETGPEVMRVVGSLQLNRTYQDADINSRFVEKYNNELSGIRGKKSRSKVVNTAAKIHTATTKKLKNFNDKTASTLMSAPDQIMNRPLWFGTFALEFKKESGVDVDFERIAGKSEAYLEKHAEAIEKAKKKADDVSIEAAASEGLFTGISKGKDWKTEKNALKGSAKFLFYNFNNFMNKFLVYEYTSFAKGWRGLMNNGTLSQKEGIALMAAVTSRMYMYSLLANTGMTGLIGLLSSLLGITDKPEEDDEDIRYGAARAGVQTLVNLSQRNFGNATRSLLNWGVEYANENYLDALREGDYNQYKNSIVYNVKPYRDNWIVPFAGPFSPVIKTATLASDAYFPDYEVTQKAAIERRNKEKYLRVPLEILAATGYLPMSNEIIKEVNADIYKDLIRGKKGGVNSSMFEKNLFNKSLFKK